MPHWLVGTITGNKTKDEKLSWPSNDPTSHCKMTPAPGFFPFVQWRTVKLRSGVCVNHAESSDTWIVIKEPCGNTGAVIFDEDSFTFQVSASVSLWEFPWVSVLECSSFFTNILLCKQKTIFWFLWLTTFKQLYSQVCCTVRCNVPRVSAIAATAVPVPLP